MGELAAFDYAVVDTDTKGKLIRHEGRIKKLYGTAMQNVYELGEELAAAQSTLANHDGGTFGKWVEQTFPFDKRSAYNFINVFTRFRDGCEIISQLPDTALYLLAAPETPGKAITEVRKLVDKGQRVTVAKTKEVIAKHKAPKEETPKEPPPAADTETSTEASGGNFECEVSKGNHQWESDGNGQRYCRECKEDHPANKPVEGPAKRLLGIAATVAKCRVLIDSVVAEYGKDTRTDAIMADLDKALIGLKRWAGAVK